MLSISSLLHTSTQWKEQLLDRSCSFDFFFYIPTLSQFLFGILSNIWQKIIKAFFLENTKSVSVLLHLTGLDLG